MTTGDDCPPRPLVSPAALVHIGYNSRKSEYQTDGMQGTDMEVDAQIRRFLERKG